jgi:hypothetical protein
VLIVRFILVALLCECPAILLWDGPITRSLITGTVAAALLITARSLRPGETKFFASIMGPLMVVAAVPALWMVVQVIPLGTFAHPMWKSAEAALGRPLTGAISIDLGISILALVQYLSITAVAFLASAIAVDRQRATSLLFALTGASSLIGLVALSSVLLPSDAGLPQFMPAAAVDSAALGMVVAIAAGIRAIERYEIRRSTLSALLPTSIASSLTLALCTSAVLLAGTYQVLIAAACGCVIPVWTKIMRRLALSGSAFMFVCAIAMIAALFLAAIGPIERGDSLFLAFTTSSSATTAVSERMLGDAPLFGTGAGTFSALQPIYREIDNSQSGAEGATAAATLAIELGKPMFGLIVAAIVAFIFKLFAASLRRGRDSFYPAMGAGCLITLLLLMFINAGLLATATSLIAASAVGIAFAQSKSRTVKD